MNINLNLKKSITLMAIAAASWLGGCATTGSNPGPVSGGARPNPLNTCIVTDNELGSMGAIITRVHEGQTVKFCCKPCVKEFVASPEKYLAKIR